MRSPYPRSPSTNTGREVLAETGCASVERCGCGTLSVHLGALSMRLPEEAVADLASALNIALAALAGQKEEEADVFAAGSWMVPRGQA